MKDKKQTLKSLTLACGLAWLHSASGYVLTGPHWSQPNATFYVDILGADGLWNAAFEDAMASWSMGGFQYNVVRQYADPCSDDGRNGVGFSWSACGDGFGSTTLAITFTKFVGDATTETDIVFDSNKSWNVFSGQSADVYDFGRVAVHELGHALGLDHEDGVPAVMATYYGDTEWPLDDDYAGVQAMYYRHLVEYCAPALNALTMNSVTNAGLWGDECTLWGLGVRASSAYADVYKMYVPSVARVKIGMASSVDSGVDPYLYLYSDDLREILAENDDSSQGYDSEINAVLQPGIYQVIASSYDQFITGPYTLTVDAEYSQFKGGDFNGDGYADILWHNTATGANVIWFMRGAQRIGASVIQATNRSWQVAAADDFNGDGRADILWRNASGGNAIWLMNGATRIGAFSLPAADVRWRVAGVGDFNADGRADILWRNQSGANAVWLMNGGTRIGAHVLQAANEGWQVVGVEDFNGDGKADVLWRNLSGANAVWFMNGGSRMAAQSVIAADVRWHVGGVGDLNADGRADILWRNSAGANAIWLMTGASRVGAQVVPSTDTGWIVSGLGDFNGDGRNDVLWRNASGANAVWFMNGVVRLGAAAITSASTSWHPF